MQYQNIFKSQPRIIHNEYNEYKLTVYFKDGGVKDIPPRKMLFLVDGFDSIKAITSNHPQGLVKLGDITSFRMIDDLKLDINNIINLNLLQSARFSSLHLLK